MLPEVEVEDRAEGRRERSELSSVRGGVWTCWYSGLEPSPSCLVHTTVDMHLEDNSTVLVYEPFIVSQAFKFSLEGNFLYGVAPKNVSARSLLTMVSRAGGSLAPIGSNRRFTVAMELGGSTNLDLDGGNRKPRGSLVSAVNRPILPSLKRHTVATTEIEIGAA